MNKLLTQILSAIVCICAVMLSCYTDPERDNPRDPYTWIIRYPSTGMFGDNLLRESGVAIQLDPARYSLHATIEGNRQVRVVLPESAAPETPLWKLSSDPARVIGWIIVKTADWTIFSASGTGTYDCEIYFTGPAQDASGEIRIYEDNAITPTIIRDISW